jgi:hypothetical protein
MEMKWLSLKYIQSKGVLMLLVQQTHSSEKWQMGERWMGITGMHELCIVILGMRLKEGVDCSSLMVSILLSLFINDGIVYLEKFNVGFQMKLFVDLCRLGVVRT